MYTKEEHFLVKLLTNNAIRLEEELSEQVKLVENLKKTNDDLHRNYNILKEKYDNAVAMLHGTEQVKQEIVTQPELFTTLDIKMSQKPNISSLQGLPTLDKTEKSNDLTPHFKMHPTRRKLTTEQAQHAYNMVTMGNATLTEMSKKFSCHEGTIHNIISGISYKEIDRTKH